MMDRPVLKQNPARKSPAAAGQRAVSRLRSPQQLVGPRHRNLPLGSLVPGVVRRVSASIQSPGTTSPEMLDAEVSYPPPATSHVTDFCRKARKLRAIHEGDPVRMHRHLSQLSVAASTDESGIQTPSDEARAEPSRQSRAIRWTWTQTARLGKGGMTILNKLGRGLSMSAEDDFSPAADPDDDQPCYTLTDPDELQAGQGYPSASDRTFAALVERTLQSQRKSPLRYSQRLSLLKEAGRRGIGRFEANLIIASVQHRLKIQTPAYTPRKPLRLPGVLTFLLVQSMIVWGVWRTIRN